MSIYKEIILIPIKEKGYVMIMPTEPVEAFDELIEKITGLRDYGSSKSPPKSDCS
jgi:hypothetical protein